MRVRHRAIANLQQGCDEGASETSIVRHPRSVRITHRPSHTTHVVYRPPSTPRSIHATQRLPHVTHHTTHRPPHTTHNAHRTPLTPRSAHAAHRRTPSRPQPTARRTPCPPRAALPCSALTQLTIKRHIMFTVYAGRNVSFIGTPIGTPISARSAHTDR